MPILNGFVYAILNKTEALLAYRNAVLEKEKAQVQAKLEREATLNKFQASRMLRGGSEDLDVDVCDAESQTVCSCQQVRIRRPTDSDHSRVTNLITVGMLVWEDIRIQAMYCTTWFF